MKTKTLNDCKVGDVLIFTAPTGTQRDHYFVSYVSNRFLCVKFNDQFAERNWEAIVDKETGSWLGDELDKRTYGKFSAKQDDCYHVGDKFSTTYGTFVLTAPTPNTRCFINIESGRRAYPAFECAATEAVTSKELNKGFGSTGWKKIN